MKSASYELDKYIPSKLSTFSKSHYPKENDK